MTSRKEQVIKNALEVKRLYDPSTIRAFMDERRAARNPERQDLWNFMFSKSGNYSSSFKEPLIKTYPELKKSKNVIKEIVEKRQKEKGSVVILDVMSYGELLRDLDVPGCAIGLKDHRKDKHKLQDAKKNIRFIEGDAFSSPVWENAREYLESQGRDTFDFIFCRPLGLIGAHMHENSLSYTWLFDKVLPLLHADNGIFLTEIHPNMINYLRHMSERLNQISGFETVISANRIGRYISNSVFMLRLTDHP